MTAAPSPEEPPAARWAASAIRYPHSAADAVGPVSLALGRGERVLLLGPSGAGKSSLLLALTGLVPKSIPAEVQGETWIGDRRADSRTPADWADTVAHCFQDADKVLCGMRVRDELAFVGENLCLPPAVIRARAEAAMARLRLPLGWLDRRSLSLSGGERQLVALAAILAQAAPILLADEPTAHLSPEAAARLHAILADGSERRSVLVVDHRLDGLIGAIDRVVVLGEGGTTLAEGPPRALFRDRHAELVRQGIWRPAASDLDACLIDAGHRMAEPPLTMDEALRGLDDLAARDAGRARQAAQAFLAPRLPPPRAPAGRDVARLEAADCAPIFSSAMLTGIDLAVRAGEVLVLLGRNGAGKTTLGASLAGLLRLKGGRRFGPPGALVMQRPDDQLATASVAEEAASMLPPGLGAGERERRAAAALAAHGLSGLERRHPATLSEGQKRRLVLAAVDAADRWPLIVLDEPSAGLDAAGTARLAARLEDWRALGRGLVLITHDLDLALRLADRVAIVGEGRILAEGPAARLLLDRDLLERHGLAEPSAAPVLRWLDRAA